MSRRIPIANIAPASGEITLGAHPDNPSGNWTPVFRGRYYYDQALGNPQDPGASSPYYLPDPGGNFKLIEATSFSIVENQSYAGRYTVFTPSSASHPFAPYGSIFSTATTIKLTSALPAPQSPGDLTTGFITNVSTYYLAAGSFGLTVPSGVLRTTGLPVGLVGRLYSGWGETLQQNLVRLTGNFAAASAPANPFLGQLWFNTGISTPRMEVWTGSAWVPLGQSVRIPFTAPANTPTAITHNLDVPAPYVVNSSFFVDIGGGVYKPILPDDVTYVSANSLTVSFTSAYSGFAIVTR